MRTGLLLFFITVNLYGYGFFIHYHITDRVLGKYETELPGLYKNRSVIAHLSGLIDDIKKVKSDEEYRHFFDWEKYGSFKQGLIPAKEFMSQYNTDFRKKNGMLPYAILEEFQEARKALGRGDTDNFVRHYAHLAHYCGDLFQPLHLTDYYDGYLQKQKGIHSYFETGFAESVWKEVEKSVVPVVYQINDLPDLLYSIILENRRYLAQILLKNGKMRVAGKEFGNDELEIRKITGDLLRNAVNFLASVTVELVGKNPGKLIPAGYICDSIAIQRLCYDPDMQGFEFVCENLLLNGVYTRTHIPEFQNLIYRNRPEQLVFLKDDYALESNLADLFCDTLKKSLMADNGIVLYNIRGLRSFLNPGRVYTGDLMMVFPFANRIAKLTMKGSDILSVLQKSLEILPVSGGVLQQSGLKAEYVRKADGSFCLGKVEYMGSPIDPEKVYPVLTNEFLAKGGDGFVSFKNAVNMEILQERDMDVFMNSLRGKFVSCINDGRNRVVGE